MEYRSIIVIIKTFAFCLNLIAKLLRRLVRQLDRAHITLRRPLDRLFALCDCVTLIFDLLT